ncbi:MAG: dihydroorotase [Methanocorpusculum sp.]|nr:dihydroorotase [Methanocorpusculum sp.]
MPSLILSNARLANGRITDITIKDGRISHIGSSNFGEKIDCHNALAIPAACDMHVHMRDGVQSAKEDWSTGTMSAAAGGAATVVDQPNSIPANETREIFIKRVNEAKRKSFTNFGVNGSVTDNADFVGLIEEGALAFGEMFAGASSYGSALTPETIDKSLEILAEKNMLVTVHAEEVLSQDVNNLRDHSKSRPVSGEIKTIELVNSLSHGARLHYCHISSAKSFDSIKGTFEVAPHHLLLNYEEAEPCDTHFRMNPPLRLKKEQRELLANFDKIPVIASDHAPHTVDEKALEFSKAPSGVPGVETMLPLLMNLVYEKKISLESVISKTVTNPCGILKIEAPSISVGARADIAVYSDVPEKIKAENLHSKAGWTPYENMNGVFPKMTVVNGCVVYRDGEFSRGENIWFRN